MERTSYDRIFKVCPDTEGDEFTQISMLQLKGETETGQQTLREGLPKKR